LIGFGNNQITLAKIVNKHPKDDLRIKGIEPDKLIARMAILPILDAMVIMP
jgi:hypothetical protein